MQIVLVQPDTVWHDAAANRRNVRAMLDADPPPPPPAKGALVVLPETSASGFTHDVTAAAEPVGGETESWYATLAADLGVTLVAGLVTPAPGGRGRNQAVVFTPAGELARYTKIHRFVLGGERNQYEPGRDVVVCDVAGVKVAPLVCYDLRFPETFRDAAAAGAEVFVVIANWPSARAEHWTALLRARAIENQAVVVGVNRVGTDPHVTYDGRSVVYGHDGSELLRLDDRPGVGRVDVDVAALRAYRAKLPFLRDYLDNYRTQGLGK